MPWMAKEFPRPDWGSGLWQRVLAVYDLRKGYVHPGSRRSGFLLQRRKQRPL